MFRPAAVFLIILLLSSCQRNIAEDEHLLTNLMKSRPALFQAYLDSAEAWEIQVIYTQINRDSANRPHFRSFTFRADSTEYFYPASTVKLPMVLLALEKLNRLQVPGLDKFTPMLHDSVYAGQQSVHQDSTAENGLPSVAHYARKILVVSDNDAYNRLYEWVGQQDANAWMHAKGYNVRLLHRLERSLTPEQNRHTESVRFVRNNSLVFWQPKLINPDSIKPTRVVKKGVGYMKGDELVREPFDFTYKNFYPLEEQQEILKAILFPESVEPHKRFDLSDDDRRFVMQYMSQLPAETTFPAYYKDTTLYDAYCKFLMYGENRSPIPTNIRIFNKVGDAYGYLIDNAYVVDFDNGVEFMLSAVINTNTDGIYNDGKYEYQRLGFPFMQYLGQLVYDYELQRKRAYAPDLTPFRLTYDRN
ncbi:MAG: serine hydrolase [Bacteroidota bacterium]